MSSVPLAPLVVLVLLLAVLVVKLVRGPVAPRGDLPKSTLARDGGQGGVGYLIPQSERAAVAALRRGQPKP